MDLSDTAPQPPRVSPSLAGARLWAGAMTHQSNHPYMPGLADAGGQVAQLRQVLALVDEIAGRQHAPARDAALDGGLDEGARVSVAYAQAWPIVQRRFD